MFAAIARSYDLNNRVHSLGLDQIWRHCAVRKGEVRPGEHVLDVACGTGDLTQQFARTRAARVVGLDFTQHMLDLAEVKRARLPADVRDKVTYVNGDAMALPFDDRSFDVVSIAFGIRNVADPDRALREFARVLRPGGRLVVLEFDRPRFAPIRWGHEFYTHVVMPRTATLISGDRSGAYRYLPKSVERFIPREELVERVSRAGFSHTFARPLSMGICALYRGTAIPR